MGLTTSLISRLGNYEIVGRLGRGGMADAYLAVASSTIEGFRKLVVLKVLHDIYTEDGDHVDMFTREAKIAARLTHPNIVQTFNITRDDGRYCIVMEYLDGVSLSTLIKRASALPDNERFGLLGIVCGALTGLHYLHGFRDYDGTDLQLVHRDVKPGNIFITFDGHVKVLDFGIAKMAATEATASHIVKGTAQYMAPETLDPTRTVDRRADVFAAGLIVWEIASGRRLWGEMNQLQILHRLAAGDLPRLDDDAGVPARLLHTCRKALAHDPAHRHATALDLKNELETFLRTKRLRYGSEELAVLVERVVGDLRNVRAVAIQARLRTLSTAAGESLRAVSPAFQASQSTTTMLSGGFDRPAQPRPPSRTTVLALALGLPLGAVLVGGGALLATHGPHGAMARLVSLVHRTPEPQPIHVRIAAHPLEARLFLDGVPLTSNPVELVGSPTDLTEHVLTATAPGHADHVTAIRLDQPLDVKVLLARRVAQEDAPPPPPAPAEPPRAGTLTLSSKPAAAVTIDDRYVGRTPLTLPVAAGKHTVRVEAAEHAPWSERVEIESGKTDRMHVDLEARKPASASSSSASTAQKRRASPPATVETVASSPAFERLAKTEEPPPAAPPSGFKKLQRKQLKTVGADE